MGETTLDALERIARAFDANPTTQHSGAAVASILRYLAHETPAAAPAAEPDAPARHHFATCPHGFHMEVCKDLTSKPPGAGEGT